MTPEELQALQDDPNEPQWIATPTSACDEPGEIGWPADASEPGDPSVPEPGSGGPGIAVVPESTPPTVGAEPVDAGGDPTVPSEVPEKKSRRSTRTE